MVDPTYGRHYNQEYPKRMSIVNNHMFLTWFYLRSLGLIVFMFLNNNSVDLVFTGQRIEI